MIYHSYRDTTLYADVVWSILIQQYRVGHKKRRRFDHVFYSRYKSNLLKIPLLFGNDRSRGEGLGLWRLKTRSMDEMKTSEHREG